MRWMSITSGLRLKRCRMDKCGKRLANVLFSGLKIFARVNFSEVAET